MRCTNYDECQTSYPLPQRGELTATGEECEPCGAPMVVVNTGRGPWKICIDPDCPAKAEAAEKKAARGKGAQEAGGQEARRQEAAAKKAPARAKKKPAPSRRADRAAA